MTAEVHFLRDLYYYYLLDNFGNPSFTETVSADDPIQKKSAELFQWIVGDLEANMGNMLSPSIRKKGQANYGRADQSAAWMLLARLYLNAEKYTGTPQWAKAKEYAAKVINESGRSLWLGDNTTTHKSANGQWSAYQMLFMADNDQSGAFNEAIFSFVQEGSSTASWGGSLFLLASTWNGDMAGVYPQKTDQAWGGNRTRKELIEKFISLTDLDALPDWKTETIVAAAGDDRALFFGVGRKSLPVTVPTDFEYGYSVKKFRNTYANGGSGHNSKFIDTDYFLMRSAEAYLIAAEADARLNGGRTTSAGAGYINQLRYRANASTQASYTTEEILDERSRELYYEGFRRTDLIRYGYFGGSNSSKYLWEWKGGAENGTSLPAYRNLYAIPAEDINANPKLTQNPGY
jgi:hypothetical protein